MRLWASCVLAIATNAFVSCLTTNETACSTIAHIQAKNHEVEITVPGQLAVDCLRSMPIRLDLSARFIDEYLKYLQFQSTLEVLKTADGLQGHPWNAVDLAKGFSNIRSKLENGYYKSQFDFDSDVDTLVSSAHDGHLEVGMCSLGLFKFEIHVPLVSISPDGIQLPELYTFGDARSMFERTGEVSPVVEINGVDAVYFLQTRFSSRVGLHDADARYNKLFPSAVSFITGTYPNGAWARNRGLWAGAETYNLTFANGTHLITRATATWPTSNGPMNYSSGTQLFQAACLNSSSGIYESTKILPQEPPKDGFGVIADLTLPEPALRDSYGLMRAYFPNTTTTKDLSILQMLDFRIGEHIDDFRTFLQSFLDAALDLKRTKLIIDLSGNNGGDVKGAFALFELLFPAQNANIATRFRATGLIDYIGQLFSESFPNQTCTYDPLAASHAASPDQQHRFQSWKELYGPHHVSNDNMSSAYAFFDRNEPCDWTGSVSRPFTHSHNFKPEDILIMTDGHCSSTCALFAHLAIAQGIRSIAFGGRPRHGPMQTIGGNKGAQHWSLRTISQHAARAYELARSSIASAEKIRLLELETIFPLPLEQFPLCFDMRGNSGVNFRNAYSLEAQEVPLQFVYQAADCRRFYRAKDYFEPSSTWEVAAMTLESRDHCVKYAEQLAGLTASS